MRLFGRIKSWFGAGSSSDAFNNADLNFPPDLGDGAGADAGNDSGGDSSDGGSDFSDFGGGDFGD